MQARKGPGGFTKDQEWNYFFCKVTKLFTTVKISKEEAIATNLKYYWSDNVCSNGHTSFRETQTDKCRICTQEDYASGRISGYNKARRMIEERKRDKEFANIGNDYYDFILED